MGDVLDQKVDLESQGLEDPCLLQLYPGFCDLDDFSLPRLAKFSLPLFFLLFSLYFLLSEDSHVAQDTPTLSYIAETLVLIFQHPPPKC